MLTPLLATCNFFGFENGSSHMRLESRETLTRLHGCNPIQGLFRGVGLSLSVP